jgi:hypothetical protein
MRYPIGVRDTWPEAFAAAIEAANMTGLRYSVEGSPCLECDDHTVWEFAPIDRPDPTIHLGVRV